MKGVFLLGLFALITPSILFLPPTYKSNVVDTEDEGITQKPIEIKKVSVKLSPHHQQQVVGTDIYYINNLNEAGAGALYCYNTITETNAKVIDGDVVDFVINDGRLFYNHYVFPQNNLYVLDLRYNDTPLLISKDASTDFVFYGNFMYFARVNAAEITGTNAIMKVSLDDYAVKLVHNKKSNNLLVHNQKLYFLDGGDTLHSASFHPTNGDLENFTKLPTPALTKFKIYNNQFYARRVVTTIVPPFRDPRLTRYDIDGTNQKDITDDYDTVDFEILDDKIYFANQVTTNSKDGFYVMPVTGIEGETATRYGTSRIWPKDIEILGQYAYFYDYDDTDAIPPVHDGNSQFYRLDLTNPTDIIAIDEIGI